MNNELNETLKNKNYLLFKKVFKKNEIVTDEKNYRDAVTRCVQDGVAIVTSIGVVTISTYLANNYNNTFGLAVGAGVLLGVGGITRFAHDAANAVTYESSLPSKREELYNIENELTAEDKKVKKLTK